MYDYLIVGAGLYGSVFAYEASRVGKKCLVLEKREHIGGNCFTEEIEGIHVHRYGAHIFHTANKATWEFVNEFATFNHFINSPIANYHGEIFNLPFNMNTFSRMWGIGTPTEAATIIAQQRGKGTIAPRNLEEQAISLVGLDVYEKLIKGYTEKQWGKSCAELPASIIRRLPVRYTYDNNYFDDPYQGIPQGGYTQIFEKLLSRCDVQLNTDFGEDSTGYQSLARKTVYTGTIDSYFDYCFGPLEYRSLRFETELLDSPNYQGVAVMNYTDRETPYTRIIEHKHFEFGSQEKTVISREYPIAWEAGKEAYYPIDNESNRNRYAKYARKAKAETNVIFGGRLGQYRYFDMDDTISEAQMCFRRENR